MLTARILHAPLVPDPSPFAPGYSVPRVFRSVRSRLFSSVPGSMRGGAAPVFAEFAC